MTDLFDGETYDPEHDEHRLANQLGRVWVALQSGRWLTLEEIQAATSAMREDGGSDSQASISARLRDLRKDRFGGYVVERQRRGDPKRGLFEYRLNRSQEQAAQPC